MDIAEITALIDLIEEKMINEDTLGFSPETLLVLDNVEASNQQIELLKGQISLEIVMRIFNIANSAYYGKLKKGSIHTFYEVVTRLGMHHTKALIIILALQILARGDEKIEAIFARSFASSVLGKILAHQSGLREDCVQKIELATLFSEIGRILIELYKKSAGADDERLNEYFTDRYHPYVTERLVERFALPDYLMPMIFPETIVVEENHITLAGLTRISIGLVAASFQKFHNQFVLEVIPPAVWGQDQSISLQTIFENQFNAVGLGKYLRIIKKRNRLLPEYTPPGDK